MARPGTPPTCPSPWTSATAHPTSQRQASGYACVVLMLAALAAAVLSVDLQLPAVLDLMAHGTPESFRRLGETETAWHRWTHRAQGGARPARVLTASPRELWDAEPSNRVYCGNYVTHALARRDYTPAGRARLLADLEAAGKRDPDNARYDYLRAGMALSAAWDPSALDELYSAGGQGSAGLTAAVTDRGFLDEAMRHLLNGVHKPAYRRNGREFLAEQCRAIGAPCRLYWRLYKLHLSAEVLLCDLGELRRLARMAGWYAQLLISEGRGEEAGPFLDAWKTMALQLNADSWTIVECLCMAGMAQQGALAAATGYERLGRPEEAARTRRQAEILASPVRQWRRQGDDPTARPRDLEELAWLRLHGMSLLQGCVLGTHRWPAREDYEAPRRLEYTVAMQACLGAIAVVQAFCMLAFLAILLRWRFLGRGAAPPRLLLPGAGGLAGLLAGGVLLPLAAFALATRYLPWSGQAYAFSAAAHKVAAEVIMLATTIMTVPVWLAARHIDRRCRELGLPRPLGKGFPAALPLAWLALVVIALGVWCVPAAIPPVTAEALEPPFCGSGGFMPPPVRHIGMAFVAVLTMAVLPVPTAIATGLGLFLAAPRYGAYCGTMARSLIPVSATAILVTCLTAGPYLAWAERHWLERDRILPPEPVEMAVTALERDTAAWLKSAVDEAAARLAEAAR